MAIRQLQLESMLDCGTWKVGRTSVGKQGHCFLEVVGAWLPEKSAGGPGLYPLEPGAEGQMAAGTPLLAQQSFSRQQPAESAERKAFLQGLSLGKATGLGAQGTTVAERVAQVLLQSLVPGCVRSRRILWWVLGGGDAPSHLGRFRAVTVEVVLAARQGASGSRPASAEAVQGAAQRAQALPEPELGLAGAPGVVGHALPSPAARVQSGRFAEGHEEQTAGQQKEDAGQGE